MVFSIPPEKQTAFVHDSEPPVCPCGHPNLPSDPPALDDAIYALHFRSHAEYCSNMEETYLAHIRGEGRCHDEPEAILLPFIKRAIAALAQPEVGADDQ